MTVKDSLDVVILGAGAAGLMCAIEAGRRGRRVAVLERAERIGKKILISGGGRCNFTNLHCTPENFISSNPHFAKSALARYTPQDFITLVKQHGIRYHEKTLGQLFCDHSAHEIVDMLEEECRRARVQVLTGIRVDRVERAEHTKGFTVYAGDRSFHGASLVIATGGLSIPKMGATGFGYEVARQFDLKIVPTRAALVPLVFNADERKLYSDLSGVSADVIAAIGKHHFREKMLITHRGLSGPAILQISSYWQDDQAVRIDLDPEGKLNGGSALLETRHDIAGLKTALRSVLPQRFADRWIESHQPQAWNKHALAEFERRVHAWQVTPEGTEGYDKAEVTAGGVDTNELLARTMESRRVPGLYFIGEVVDVTGHLGGFNFQWAWASGFCAGQAV
jgi:predicted Rossmann fold flavoprotein